MATSVLEAIRLGEWDFEPENVAETHFESTKAMPGTNEKLDILARRVQEGLPLWHSSDRMDYDDELKTDDELERILPCQR